MPHPNIPLNISAEDVTGKMFLREKWCEGEFQGKPFSVSVVIGGVSMIVEYAGEQWKVALDGGNIEKILVSVMERQKEKKD